MKNIIYPILVLILFVSCEDERMKFESEKWKPYESGISIGEYRKIMVWDLVKNVLRVEHRHKNPHTYHEVIGLIGEPESVDINNGFAKFLVDEKFDYNIDPNGYVYLHLYFNKDSLLQNWVIVDTEFEP